MTLDFIKDYKDILDKQGMQYIIVILREFQEKDNVDIFLNIKNDESLNKIQLGVQDAMQRILDKQTINEGAEEKPSKSKIDKPKKKT